MKFADGRGHTSAEPYKQHNRLGRTLREYRESRHYSQRRLAAESKTDLSKINKYERGKTIPTIPILVRIAKALKYPPGELINAIVEDEEWLWNS